MTHQFQELTSEQVDDVSGGLSVFELAVNLVLQVTKVVREAAGMD